MVTPHGLAGEAHANALGGESSDPPPDAGMSELGLHLARGAEDADRRLEDDGHEGGIMPGPATDVARRCGHHRGELMDLGVGEDRLQSLE